MHSPLDQNEKLQVDKGVILVNPVRYRTLVGKLIYLTVTRPNLSFSVQLLSQFMNHPTDLHFAAAIRLLRYLKYSMNKGIWFSACSKLELRVYCDSD